ncbi:MAG: phosphoribosyltransferase [Cyclobacteriaceae bacterium]|nr:phosphoribosyltransferase [Cyclobacteriaceae bacterium]
MTSTDNQILNKKQVLQKISRIAYEIYENHYLEKKIYLAGVPETGFRIAEMIKKELDKVSPLDVRLTVVHIDKQDPFGSEVTIDCNPSELKNKSVILVDDVLHTGRTFLNSLKPFLSTDIRQIETAVLVDRGHKLFPISADYKGYELATMLNDHIEVSLEKGRFGVYLL